MIWTTWRQHRAEAGVAALVLAGLVAGLLMVGERARQRADALGLPGCLHGGGDCSTALDALHRDFHSIPPFIAAMVAIPLLAGMFWAAPLVSREFEGGTHRLAWSQSVSPRRWMLTKIALIFGVLTVASLALGFLATWTLDPLAPAFGGRYNSTWYDTQGIVPAACMLFALAAGLLFSVALRRTIPAMAVTLAVYAAARIPMHWVRGYFVPTSSASQTQPMVRLLSAIMSTPQDLFSSLTPAGALARGTSVLVEPAGTAVSSHASTIDLLRQYCPTLQVTRSADAIRLVNANACRTALHHLSLKGTARFQAASHFWAVQAIEVAIFVVVAAALTGAAVALVARRRPG